MALDSMEERLQRIERRLDSIEEMLRSCSQVTPSPDNAVSLADALSRLMLSMQSVFHANHCLSVPGCDPADLAQRLTEVDEAMMRVFLGGNATRKH